MATTYRINKMRVVRPSEKISEKHPERVFTVFGQFFKEGEKAPLSITSKNIDRDDISSPDFLIDVANGYLTLTEGQKGRRKSESISQEDIEAELKALRGE
jgi:hypothetical protein